MAKGQKQEKKKTQKSSHRMSEGQREIYNSRRAEKKLRHMLRRNGTATARDWADRRWAATPIFRKLESSGLIRRLEQARRRRAEKRVGRA